MFSLCLLQFTKWQQFKECMYHIPNIGMWDYWTDTQTDTGQSDPLMRLRFTFTNLQNLCYSRPIIYKELEYWQSQEGPHRVLCKFVGAMLKFLKSRSKVIVKVTCSKFMVPSERSCHKVHTCQIWKPYLLQ